MIESDISENKVADSTSNLFLKAQKRSLPQNLLESNSTPELGRSSVFNVLSRWAQGATRLHLDVQCQATTTLLSIPRNLAGEDAAIDILHVIEAQIGRKCPGSAAFGAFDPDIAWPVQRVNESSVFVPVHFSLHGGSVVTRKNQGRVAFLDRHRLVGNDTQNDEFLVLKMLDAIMFFQNAFHI